MKKILWTALVAGTATLGAALAARAVDRLWRRITHEPPPEVPKWAHFLVGMPVQKGVNRQMPLPRF